MDEDLLDSLLETLELSQDPEFVLSFKKAEEEEIEKGEFSNFKDVFGERI